MSGYHNEFRDLINYAVNPVNLQQYKMVNIDRFKTAGVTLENKLRTRSLQAALGVGYLGRFNQFSDVDTYKNQDLPAFAWSPEVNASLMYDVKKIGTQFSLFYKWTGKRPGYQLVTVNGQEKVGLTRIDPFNWADLTATKNLLRFLTISAGVRNLFNVTTLASSAADNGGAHSSTGPVPMAYGRSGFVSLQFQWSKGQP